MAHSHSHDHNHEAHDHHHHVPAKLTTAFAVAALLNLAFAVTEASFGILNHSMALLADGLHNLGDVVSLLMAWFTTALLNHAATTRYSYGYKKATILSAVANALLLVFTSAIIIYESIDKLFHPVAVNEIIVILIAFIGILINGGSSLLFLKGQENDLNIKAAFLHLAYDALISAGVIIAGIIIYFTGWIRLDPLIGLIIVTIILFGTWRLLKNSIDLILGAVPYNVDPQAVREYLLSIDGVTAVHDLHIWGLSTQENALTAHLVMPEKTLTDADYHRINHILRHDFKVNHVTLQIEKGSTEDPCGQAVTC